MDKPVKRKDEGASYELHMAIWYLLWLSDDSNGFYDFKFGVQLQVRFLPTIEFGYKELFWTVKK